MNCQSIYPELCGSGAIKSEYADFIVEERLPFDCSGQGEHLYLYIKKINANTRYVVGQLAAHFQCNARDIGYAGMKDRHGITSQWFSVYLTKAGHKEWQDLTHPKFEIIQASLHNKKLKIGDLQENHFDITIRQFDGDFEVLQQRFAAMESHGFANYFGSQRFGNQGNTLLEAKQWLLEGKKVNRNQEGLYISALRSALFNQILSERVKRGVWNKVLLGELAFNVHSEKYELVESVEDGLKPGLIPTIQLFGRDRFVARSEAGDIEKEVFVEHDDICQQLLKKKVNADRRACFTRPTALQIQLQEPTVVKLSFTLDKGCYATVLMEQLLGITNAAPRYEAE